MLFFDFPVNYLSAKISIRIRIRKLYFDSAHNKTVQHKLINPLKIKKKIIRKGNNNLLFLSVYVVEIGFFLV
jgi:hypothetical protein